MSTIYDLANIQSGDARGRQELAFDSAQAQLGQYRKEKQIIEDMNDNTFLILINFYNILSFLNLQYFSIILSQYLLHASVGVINALHIGP